MNIAKALILAWLAFSVGTLILNIGKPREPLTPKGVVMASAVVCLLAVLVVIA